MNRMKRIIAVFTIIIMTIVFAPWYYVEAKKPNHWKEQNTRVENNIETRIEDEDSTDKTGYWVLDNNVNWDKLSSTSNDVKYTLNRGVLYTNGKAVAKFSRGAVAPTRMFFLGNYIFIYGGRFGVAVVDVSNLYKVRFIGPNNMFKSSNITVNELKYAVDNNGKVVLYMKYTCKDGKTRIYRYESSMVNRIVAVKSVTLNKERMTLAVGESQTLTAKINPSNAANKKVSWFSTNPDVATVDQNGKVTGISEGETTITVITQDGGKTDACKVTVGMTTSVSSISLNKEHLYLAAGDSETLTATVKPSNAANKNLVWYSNNPDAAIVDQSGKVTGIKQGEATIIVITQDGGKMDRCLVTVGKTAAVNLVTLNKEYITLAVGESETLIAAINPSNASNKNLLWFSTNPEVAAVDQNGKVTGVKQGEATIIVVSQDGGKTDACQVIVSTSNN